MASILKQRRDTTANWTSVNPVIPDGQLCFDLDLNQYRMGNGVDAYLDLPQGGLTGSLSSDLDFNGFTANKSAVRQVVDSVPADASTHTFDYTLGDMQQITCPAAGTLTAAFNGFPVVGVSAFVIDLINGGDCTITWPAGIQYAAGTPPALTPAGTDRLLVTSDKDAVLTLTVVALDIKG